MSEIAMYKVPKKLSHSMVDAYMSCQKKFEFAHLLNIAPRETPNALAVGIWGHKVFETFFLEIQKSGNVELAQAAALAFAYQDKEKFLLYSNQFIYWFDEIWPTLGWEILEVEKTFVLPINSTLEYPFTVDLIIRVNGQLLIVDHKFTSDAYAEELLLIYPQIPKYAGALRALKEQGYPVASGLYNIMRTRKMKNDFDSDGNYQRQKFQPVRFNNARIKDAMLTHLTAAVEIQKHVADPDRPFLRNISHGCKYCSFIDLCGIEVSGGTSQEFIEQAFAPNTYGYELEA